MESNNKLGCCCLLILIIAIASILSGSDGETSYDQSEQNNEIIEEKINASGANMTFFGLDTPIGREGYQFCTFDENHTIYYMTYDVGMKVASADPNTKMVINWDLEESSNEGYQYSGSTIGRNGINHILSYQPRNHESIQFQYPREGNFSFTYKNKTVLNNENAKEITKVYYSNGTEITD